MKRKKMPTAIILEFLSDLILIAGVIMSIWYWYNYADLIISIVIFLTAAISGFSLRMLSNIGEILLRFALDISPHIKHTIPNQLIQNDIHLIQLKSTLEENLIIMQRKLDGINNSLNSLKELPDLLRISSNDNKEILEKTEHLISILSEAKDLNERKLDEIKENLTKLLLKVEKLENLKNIVSILEGIENSFADLLDNIKPLLKLGEMANLLGELNYKLDRIENFINDVKKRLSL